MQAVVEEEEGKKRRQQRRREEDSKAGKELRDRSTRFARIYFHFQLLNCVTESMFAYVCVCV